ncbi:DMT family transporter [Dysgonomonas sp. ZJ279]|uniref:DMT family transporter n=1 Tax=Dysgonomonas sp. ZJ279 TaxID=2709796 RepID=UPI0013EE2250|nr:DMT family transporter [Dysgonomonas sp. ZJ279]
MAIDRVFWYHFMAVITVCIWGVTFVSTKVLIGYGLSPIEIFFFRFVLAYICICFVSPRKLFANSFKDELWMVGAGLSGGSLYFITENTALGLTLASNVSLIICTTPILTAFLFYFVNKEEKLKRNLLIGSFIALAGVALVVFNGRFNFEVNPLGDILTFVAALMWAFYCLILRRMNTKYSILFFTRKVFFYGVITSLPMFIISPLNFNLDILLKPVVFSNLLFLGVVASMLCFIMWNNIVKRIGALRATNYLYIVPLVTMITSALVIDEQITIITLVGSCLILFGVYLVERSR